MTPVERFARLREILLTLPALSDREERESYLDEICGDDLALRQEALSLFGRNPDEELPSVARTGGLAQRVGFVAADLPMPDSIGPYAVLGVLGRGGMGIVYRGEQREPLQREVAIKLVHIGLDRERVLSRFRAERQALALMEHPSIARVFDAGEDQEGRPYFVMELVRGVPRHRVRPGS